MSSIIKVDQIQLSDGSTPTAGDLGIDIGETGKVLNVQQKVISDRPSFSSSSWSLVSDGTNAFEITMTPTNANSKFLIEANVHGTADTRYFGFRCYYNGSTPIGIGNANNQETRISFSLGQNPSYGVWDYGTFNSSFKYLHSPNTTSDVTYNILASIFYGAGTAYLNRPFYVDTGNTYTYYPISTFTVTEIAG